MTRIKGGLQHSKRRRGILKHTRGFMWGRKSKIKVAKIAGYKAGQYAFAGRKQKKRVNRSLWQVRINAAARQLDISYSKLMGLLKAKNITIDRKVLSQLAVQQSAIFKKIVELAKV
ncbi:MAG: 50S ribosomal protein L20 [Patescibacteria group bacterium]